jgi:hypothetical protein
MKTAQLKPESTAFDKVRQFDEAPDGALFDQKIIAAKLVFQQHNSKNSAGRVVVFLL